MVLGPRGAAGHRNDVRRGRYGRRLLRDRIIHKAGEMRKTPERDRRVRERKLQAPVLHRRRPVPSLAPPEHRRNVAVSHCRALESWSPQAGTSVRVAELETEAAEIQA